LRDIRNNAANAMARIGAIRQLEQMEEIATGGGGYGGPKAGWAIDLREMPPAGIVVHINCPPEPRPPEPINITPDRTIPTTTSPHAFGLQPRKTPAIGG
jgi:hypothetical protein